jgi:hypothetical protein
VRWLRDYNGVVLDGLFLQHEGVDGKGSQRRSLREGDDVPVDERGAPCAGVLISPDEDLGPSHSRRQELADWYEQGYQRARRRPRQYSTRR